jgi:hypothetical protein
MPRRACRARRDSTTSGAEVAEAPLAGGPGCCPCRTLSPHWGVEGRRDRRDVQPRNCTDKIYARAGWNNRSSLELSCRPFPAGPLLRGDVSDDCFREPDHKLLQLGIFALEAVQHLLQLGVPIKFIEALRPCSRGGNLLHSPSFRREAARRPCYVKIQLEYIW